MADGVSVSLLKPQQRPSKQNPPPPPTNFRSRFLFRALIAIFFFVFIPILPSIAPEFFDHNLFSQSWELLHIVFVGIAVSYGLFSRRYDDPGGGEVPPKPDSAQSYVSRLLQASSVFEDDVDSPTSSSSDDGGNKVQTWSSQYFRNEPVVVVASKKQSSVISRDDEDHRPLLLPVRSLKSRVSDENGGGENSRVSGRSYARSRSYSSSSAQKEPLNWEKKIRNGSLKSRASDFNSFSGKSDTDLGFCGSNPNSSLNGAMSTDTFNEEESIVLPSPIPWRSRSGRLEKKEDVHDPPLEEMDPNPSRWTSKSTSVKPFPAPACLFESNSKRSEDLGRKKTVYRSPPPPPPPPPPPAAFYNKPPLAKSRTIITDHGNDKSKLDYSSSVKSCRTVRSARSWKEAEEEEEEELTMNYKQDENSFSDYTNEGGHEDFLGEVHAMSDDDDDDDDHDDDNELGETEKQENGKEESVVAGVSLSSGVDDGGPDVDKKADEFIAKFREQIRLQRIESIKRSTGQLSRSSLK